MTLQEQIQAIDRLKKEIEALRPLSPERERRIMDKFRLDRTYHSNAIEGNTLTYGETKAFLLHGITAAGKPFGDYLEMRGHHQACQPGTLTCWLWSRRMLITIWNHWCC